VLDRFEVCWKKHVVAERPNTRTHSCEPCFAGGVWCVAVDVFEKGWVVTHNLLVDRKRIRQVWLIGRTAGVHHRMRLAEPIGRHFNRGRCGHAERMLVTVRRQANLANLARYFQDCV
jgi:hypothetical protein